MKFRLLLLFVLLFLATASFSQTADDCLVCHSDNSLTTERNGKEISLFIDPNLYSASSHKALNCVDCHQGFNPEEIPHADPIKKVDCSTCHSEEERTFQHSAHSTRLECTSCHTNAHAPLNSTNIVAKCQTCHQNENSQLKKSIHGLVKAGPTCINCHSPHAVETVNSEKCLACHGERKFVHKSIIHENIPFVLSYKESIHAAVIECADCHTGHNVLPADSARSTVNKSHIVETCSNCHDDVASNFKQSEHYTALQQGFAGAPTCTSCHGEHDIHQITDSRSLVSRQHEIEICMDCHLDSPEVAKRMTHTVAFVADYHKSIHGRQFQKGDTKAAICSDCHTAHREKKAIDPASTVNKMNIPKTCGKCHNDVTKQYDNSVHGEALARGVKDAPSCTDCHGEHEIIEPESPQSPVSPIHLSQQVCGRCHSSVKLSKKYGLPSDRYNSYVDSYHGLATKFGDVEAANCASCHGVHDILPSSDPRSRTNKANLASTCGTCHPGANENFAKGKVHIIRSPQGDKLIYWISTIYIFVIIGTIGSMAFHNILDWLRKSIERYRERYKVVYRPAPEHKTKLYLRMTVNERIQHCLLAISFLTLVVTGFMLKFPDAFWVTWIRSLGGEAVFQIRGIVHRVAGVVMIADAFYHIYYVIFTKRGRQFIKDIMFRYKDFQDMIQMFRYNMGMDSKRPLFDRFNYIEKSEYWALIWGTVVMSTTGIAMWFNTQFIDWFSKLFIDVATVIHYFEAWLAFLAILVWHFYYVIFNPDVYPMNFSWLTGKVTEEEMEKEHPLELQRIKKQESSLEFSKEMGKDAL